MSRLFKVVEIIEVHLLEIKWPKYTCNTEKTLDCAIIFVLITRYTKYTKNLSSITFNHNQNKRCQTNRHELGHSGDSR